jgi:hypothetical protein
MIIGCWPYFRLPAATQDVEVRSIGFVRLGIAVDEAIRDPIEGWSELAATVPLKTVFRRTLNIVNQSQPMTTQLLSRGILVFR